MAESDGQRRILTTWAPTEFGPMQFTYCGSEWLSIRFFRRLSCSKNGNRAIGQLYHRLGSGAFGQLFASCPGMFRPAGKRLYDDSKLWQARPSCLRLFWHFDRAAASRTFCTAGRSRPINTAMMAITTNSSISVKAERTRRRDEGMAALPGIGTRTGMRLLLEIDRLEHVFLSTHLDGRGLGTGLEIALAHLVPGIIAGTTLGILAALGIDVGPVR